MLVISVPYSSFSLPYHSSEEVSHIVLDEILDPSLVWQVGEHQEHLFREWHQEGKGCSHEIPPAHPLQVASSQWQVGSCFSFHSSSSLVPPTACWQRPPRHVSSLLGRKRKPPQTEYLASAVTVYISEISTQINWCQAKKSAPSDSSRKKTTFISGHKFYSWRCEQKVSNWTSLNGT